jgi:hypothetical protein
VGIPTREGHQPVKLASVIRHCNLGLEAVSSILRLEHGLHCSESGLCLCFEVTDALASSDGQIPAVQDVLRDQDAGVGCLLRQLPVLRQCCHDPVRVVPEVQRRSVAGVSRVLLRGGVDALRPIGEILRQTTRWASRRCTFHSGQGVLAERWSAVTPSISSAVFSITAAKVFTLSDMDSVSFHGTEMWAISWPGNVGEPSPTILSPDSGRPLEQKRHLGWSTGRRGGYERFTDGREFNSDPSGTATDQVARRVRALDAAEVCLLVDLMYTR